MKVSAIVYLTQTGSTAEYAQLLSQRTGLPAYSLQDALLKLDKAQPVLFMSWVMGGRLVDYKKAARRLNIVCCSASCLNPMPGQADLIKNASDIPDDMPCFTLPGAYRPDRLHGVQKLVMALITKLLAQKMIRGEDEGQRQMREVLTKGGSFVEEENLNEICSRIEEI